MTGKTSLPTGQWAPLRRQFMTYQLIVDGEKIDADFVGALSLDNLQRMADEAVKHGRPLTRLRSHPETRNDFVDYFGTIGFPRVDEIPFEADATLPRDVIICFAERPL